MKSELNCMFLQKLEQFIELIFIQRRYFAGCGRGKLPAEILDGLQIMTSPGAEG